MMTGIPVASRFSFHPIGSVCADWATRSGLTEPLRHASSGTISYALLNTPDSDNDALRSRCVEATCTLTRMLIVEVASAELGNRLRGSARRVTRHAAYSSPQVSFEGGEIYIGLVTGISQVDGDRLMFRVVCEHTSDVEGCVDAASSTSLIRYGNRHSGAALGLDHRTRNIGELPLTSPPHPLLPDPLAGSSNDSSTKRVRYREATIFAFTAYFGWQSCSTFPIFKSTGTLYTATLAADGYGTSAGNWKRDFVISTCPVSNKPLAELLVQISVYP